MKKAKLLIVLVLIIMLINTELYAMGPWELISFNEVSKLWTDGNEYNEFRDVSIIDSGISISKYSGSDLIRPWWYIKYNYARDSGDRDPRYATIYYDSDNVIYDKNEYEYAYSLDSTSCRINNVKHIVVSGYLSIKRRSLNNTPVLTLRQPTSNSPYSAVEGHNTITFSGKVSDADGDRVDVSVTMDGKTKTAVVNPAPTTTPGSDNWSVTFNVATDNIQQGVYNSSNVTITAVDKDKSTGDAKGGTANATLSTTLTVDKTPPTVNAPTVTANSPTQITVQPNASDPAITGGITGLHSLPYLYNKNNINIGDYQAGNYIDTGLTPNTLYEYKYKAKDLAGNISNYSNTVSKYTLANIPNNLNINDVTNTSIALGWSNNNNPSGTTYELDRDGTTIYTGTELSYVDSTIVPGVTYKYKVRARNGENIETAYSNELTYRINTAPTLVELTDIGINDVTVAWDKNGNPVGTEYKISLYKADNTQVGEEKTYIQTDVENNVVFDGLIENEQYYAKVKTKVSETVYTEYTQSLSKYTLANVPSVELINATQDAIEGNIKFLP